MISPSILAQCGRSVSPLVEIPAGGIYKWTDEAGITHYLDSHGNQPLAGSVLVTRFPEIRDYFSLQISSPDMVLGEPLQSQLHQSGNAIYQYYIDALGKAGLSRAKIELVIYSNQQAYRQRRDAVVAQGNDQILGFYTSGNNQAVIFHSGDDRAAYLVATHEMAHAIQQQLFGDIPRWLNEGLAVFMERRVSELATSRVTSDQRKRHLLQTVLKQASVAGLVKDDGLVWNAEMRSYFYQLSDVLVEFLVTQHSDFIHGLLKERALHACESFDVAAYMERHWSGGIGALNTAFRDWIELWGDPRR